MKLRVFIPLLSLLGVFSFFAFKYYQLETNKPISAVARLETGINGTFINFPWSSNLWFPSPGSTDIKLPKPNISGKSAFVVDLKIGKVLFAKNEHEPAPIASTVKILTAGVALERKKSSDIFMVSDNATKIGEDFMGISAGEKLTLEELLYGLLLPSGNDAAEAIVEGVSGSRADFVTLMNEKAKLLGANNSKFVNPSGLEGDGEHFSTAYDLTLISRWVWTSFPLFREIVGTKYFELPYSENHKYFYLENQTNLLGTYPGVKGIKPGYTPEAGLCLVTLAERDGHEILGVVLGSQDRRGDMEKLLNYSFSTLGI